MLIFGGRVVYKEDMRGVSHTSIDDTDDYVIDDSDEDVIASGWENAYIRGESSAEHWTPRTH